MKFCLKVNIAQLVLNPEHPELDVKVLLNCVPDQLVDLVLNVEWVLDVELVLGVELILDVEQVLGMELG